MNELIMHDKQLNHINNIRKILINKKGLGRPCFY